MPKNLAWTQQLYVTIMSQVVVYAPAERADTFSLFPLSPSILLGTTTICPCLSILLAWPSIITHTGYIAGSCCVNVTGFTVSQMEILLFINLIIFTTDKHTRYSPNIYHGHVGHLQTAFWFWFQNFLQINICIFNWQMFCEFWFTVQKHES